MGSLFYSLKLGCDRAYAISPKGVDKRERITKALSQLTMDDRITIALTRFP